MRRGFTLVELITTIVILALLTATLVVTIPNFINWARETSDKQTLAVLNDALNRYKTQGGDVNALTTGTPIAHVISKLQTAVTWSGKGHEFLSGGRTYFGRSLAAIGEHHQYRFTRYDHYEAEAGGSSPVSPFPYGEGVGYVSNGGDPSGYPFLFIATTSGYFSVLPEGGSQQTFADGYFAALAQANSVTLWSSDSSGNPAGSITVLDCSSVQPTSLSVSGLTNLLSLICASSPITALDVSGMTNLLSVDVSGCQNLTALNLTGCTSLGSIMSVSCPNLVSITGLSTCIGLGSNGSRDFAVCYSTPPLIADTAAVDALYTSLPNVLPGNAILYIGDSVLSDHPGDTSIATAKGWVVNGDY